MEGSRPAIISFIGYRKPQVIERGSNAPFVAELPAQAQAFLMEFHSLRIVTLFGHQHSQVS